MPQATPAAALFAYAAAFSYAYLSLTAATGALLLFGAVQTTMIAVDFSAARHSSELPANASIASSVKTKIRVRDTARF